MKKINFAIMYTVCLLMFKPVPRVAKSNKVLEVDKNVLWIQRDELKIGL